MKKELFLPLIIFALTLVFAVICLMVYLSKGNAYWIKRKLKIGALLLTFNGIVYGTSGQGYADTCYLQSPPPTPQRLGITFGSVAVTHDSPQLNSTEITDIKLQNAKGNGFFAGLTYELQSRYNSSLSSIIVNMKYISKPGRSEYSFIKQLNDPKPEPSIKTLKFSSVEAEYSFSFINFEILYKQNFYKPIPLGLVVGTYFSIPIALKAKETGWEINNQINNHEKVIYDGEIIEGSSIDIGLITGIQYEINLSEDLVIVPNISYHYPLTLIQNPDWSVSSFDFGISVRYNF